MKKPVQKPRKPKVGNSFAEKHPELLNEWSNKNERRPEDLSYRSGIKVTWACSERPYHIWEASLEKRSKGRGCPYCPSNKNHLRTAKIHKLDSFGVLHPDLAQDWDEDKNKKSVFEVSPIGSERIFWKCKKCSTEWRNSIKERVEYKRRQITSYDCPKCFRSKEDNLSLLKAHPEILQFWNDKKDPNNFTFFSKTKVNWKCPRKHSWEEGIAQVVRRKNTCLACTREDKENSTEIPQVVFDEWHPDKNDTKGFTVKLIHSLQKSYWWKCLKSEHHEWETSLANRLDGLGCPYCAGKRVAVDNNLEYLNPELAKEWHPDNEIKASECRPGTHQRFLWRCKKNSKHVWRAAVLDRSVGDGCPFCANKKIIKEENSLAATHPEISKLWCYERNDDSPEDYVAGTKTTKWWQCNKEITHKWHHSIRDMTINSSECPFCVTNWSPRKFKNILKEEILNYPERSSSEWKNRFIEIGVLHPNQKKEKLGSHNSRVAYIISENNIPDREIIRYIEDEDSLVSQFYSETEFVFPVRREHLPKKLREATYKKYQNQCQNPYCESFGTKLRKSDLAVDHIIPYSICGEHKEENLQLLCQGCNSRKSFLRWERFLEKEKVRIS